MLALNRVRFLIGRSALTLLASPLFAFMAHTSTSALLARVSPSFMLAYLRSYTLLALALLAVVGADAGAPAYLAHAPVPVMLAYLRSSTLLAPLFDTVVVTDA